MSEPIRWGQTLPDRIVEPTAVWMFEEGRPIQKILHCLKYANSPWLGLELGCALGDVVVRRINLISGETVGAEPDRRADRPVVVPVPLHESRRLERGYNQSEWIARGVAQRLGISIDARSLVRQASTRSQTTLSREERWLNVSKAFKVVGSNLQGRVVVLVDDTITTGATLFSCAKVVLDAGAFSVVPAGVATAPLRLAVEPPSGFPVIPA